MSGTTIFDTNQKGSNVTLSGGSLVATLSNTTQGSVRATRVVTQPIYVEFAATLIGTTYRLGLADFAFGITGTAVLGVNTDGVAINAADGTVKINNVTIGTVVAFTTADNVDMAYNPQLKLIWFRINNGNWNNNVANNPASATLTDAQGGFDCSTLIAFQLFPAFSSGGTTNAAVTAKFSTAFTRTAPTGFVSVDADPGAVGTVDARSDTASLAIASAHSDPPSAFNYEDTFTLAATKGAFYGISKNDPSTRTAFWSPAATQTNISGTVTINGSPAAKKVKLYDQDTGEWLGEALSNAGTGVYSIPALGRSKVYVVATDETVAFDALVFDEVTPV